VRRFVLLLLWPRAVWADLSARPASPARLVLMLLAFALAIAVAHQVGWRWLNTHWSATYGWSPEPLFGARSVAVVFVFAFGGPLAMAAVLAWLAPWCGGRRDWPASLSVAVWGALPLLVAACSLFFMPMIVLCLFAVVACFRLYAEGVCALLGVPPEDGPELVIGAFFAMGALASITGLGLDLLL
jgi:hypothetical protein